MSNTLTLNTPLIPKQLPTDENHMIVPDNHHEPHHHSSRLRDQLEVAAVSSGRHHHGQDYCLDEQGSVPAECGLESMYLDTNFIHREEDLR